MRAELVLEGPHARTLAAALAPEQGPEGSTMRLEPHDDRLVIGLVADDLSTLRAALQGTLRLADAALRSLARADDGND